MVSCHVLLYFNKYWTSWCILPAPPCGTGHPSCGFVVFQLPPPPPPVEQDGFPFCHTHTHHVFVNVWPFYLPSPLLWNRMVFPFALRHIHTHTPRVCVCMAFSLRACFPAKPPFHSSPPFPHPMVSCHVLLYFNKYWTSWCILPAPPCGTGHPSCGFVVFQLPPPTPPPVEQDGFPFCTHTYTHTPCLCECMAILSPKPPPVEQDGFPFCSETHTHTHTPRLCVCMAFSLRTCSSTGCGTPVVGVLQASRLQALVFGGGIPLGGGGGRGGVRTHSAQPYIHATHIYIYMTICI